MAVDNGVSSSKEREWNMLCGACTPQPTRTARTVDSTSLNDHRRTKRESSSAENGWDIKHPWVRTLGRRPSLESWALGLKPPRSNDDEYADLPAMVEHAVKRQSTSGSKKFPRSSVASRLRSLTPPPGGRNLLMNVKVVDDIEGGDGSRAQ